MAAFLPGTQICMYKAATALIEALHVLSVQVGPSDCPERLQLLCWPFGCMHALQEGFKTERLSTCDRNHPGQTLHLIKPTALTLSVKLRHAQDFKLRQSHVVGRKQQTALAGHTNPTAAAIAQVAQDTWSLWRHLVAQPCASRETSRRKRWKL